MADIFNNFKQAFNKLSFKRDGFQKAKESLRTNNSEAQEEAGLIKETNRAHIFSLSTNDDFVTVSFLKEQSEDNTNRRLHAAKILSDRNIFGLSKIIAADSQEGIIVREGEPGTDLAMLAQNDDQDWHGEEFLSLMLTLDQLIKLDINPLISSENITHAYDEHQSSSIGFIVNDYVYDEGINDSVDLKKRRATIISMLRETVLATMKQSIPEESNELEHDFNLVAEMFVDTDYLKYEANFEAEARNFEPSLSSIAKKLDHNNSSGDPKYLEELSPEEQSKILGNGGECVVITGKDPNKVAKIYFKGNVGSVQEIKALDRAFFAGIHDVAMPIGFKDNIVIETKLPGKDLAKLAKAGKLKDPDFVNKFKKFLPRFFKNFEDISQAGIFPDPGLSNLMFDEESGISIPDLRLEEFHQLKTGVENISDEIKEFSNSSDEILGEDLHEEYFKAFNSYLENRFQYGTESISRIKKAK